LRTPVLLLSMAALHCPCLPAAHQRCPPPSPGVALVPCQDRRHPLVGRVPRVRSVCARRACGDLHQPCAGQATVRATAWPPPVVIRRGVSTSPAILPRRATATATSITAQAKAGQRQDPRQCGRRQSQVGLQRTHQHPQRGNRRVCESLGHQLDDAAQDSVDVRPRHRRTPALAQTQRLRNLPAVNEARGQSLSGLPPRHAPATGALRLRSKAITCRSWPASVG
jgi:hypothetical protein